MAPKITRKTDLTRYAEIREQLLDQFHKIDRGYQDQRERADDNLDWWDIYHCKLGSKQFYAGESRGFVPFVADAVDARKTRFSNQIFPQAGRYIDVTSEDGEIPHAMMALGEYYVEAAELRTQVVPALCVQADVEGQMTILVSWENYKRHIVSRETKPITIGGLPLPPEMGETTEYTEEESIDEFPPVEIIPDSDYLVLPVTANTGQQALAKGGSITIIRRWTKTQIKDMAERGEIREDLADHLEQELSKADPRTPNLGKKFAEVAGIRGVGDSKCAVVYRTWTMVKLPGKGGERRLVLAYYGGNDVILGAKLCPYWNDKPDVISQPVNKLGGIHKGMSLVKRVADLQYGANDIYNQARDSATRSLLPIVMTDPEKNPRVSSMVLDMGAVWETSPRDTQMLSFPPLHEQAGPLLEALKSQIFQSLSVNPSMLPQQTGVPGRRRNQAEIAAEQQVDLLTTSVAVTNIESGILTPMLQLFMDYDYQFRDQEITVRSFGELGVKAEMVRIPPQQSGKRWRFRWFGVEAARAAAQVQQLISAVNVVLPYTQHPSVAASGKRFNVVPLIRHVLEAAAGPRLAPELFEDVLDQITVPVELENTLLAQGHAAMVSPLDNDPQHIQAHSAMLQQFPFGTPQHVEITKHLAAHQQQIKSKQMAQMMAAMGQMQQQPGGQPQGPARGQMGRPGPRRGAAPQPPRGGQQPPGAIHADRLPAAGGGILPFPRKM